jgi:hypothetical protein
MYCGKKKNPPKGKRFGNPNECFLKGRRSGFIGGLTKGLVPLTRDSLNSLRKDVIREIASRFGVRRYSLMSKEELITNILDNRGNATSYNLDNLKN